VADAWTLELEDLDQLGEALPIVAPALTAAVQQAVEHPCDLIEEVSDAIEVTPDTVVVVVPTQLRIERREELVLAHPAVFTTPCLEVRQGGPVFRPCRAELERGFPPATTPPTELESQEFEAAARLLSMAAKTCG